MTDDDRTTTPGPGPTPSVDGADVTATENRLRAALHARAAATPVTDGLGGLRARVASDHAEGPSVADADPGPTPVTELPARPSPQGVDRPTERHRFLLVAAAVVAVLAVGAAAIGFGRADRDRSPSIAGGRGEDPATGWYVPMDLPAGWTLHSVERRVTPLDPTDDDRVAFITLRAPSRLWVGVELRSPTSPQPWDPPSSAATVAVDGAPGPLREITELGTDNCAGLSGRWPGATVSVLGSCKDDADGTDGAPGVAAQDVRTVVSRLRPVTAAVWARYVRSAPEHDEGVIRPTLADLPTDPTLVGPDEPDDGAVEPTPTTAPADGSSQRTSPADSRTTEQAEPNGAIYDDLSGLRFTLVLDRRSVVSGATIGAELTIDNTTDDHRLIHECTFALTAIELVPAATPDVEVEPDPITDCYQTPVVRLPPHVTNSIRFGIRPDVPTDDDAGDPDTREPLAARRRAPMRSDGSRLLGALAAGEYLATVVVPGRTGSLRVQVPVTIEPAPCDGFTDDLVRALWGRTNAEARARAAALGKTLRVTSIDGVGQAVTEDFSCDRVNVETWNGTITTVTGLG